MSRRDGDVLLAFRLVRNDAAGDRTPGVEGVEPLSIARVEREKIPAQIAGEQHVAGSRRERGVPSRPPRRARDERRPPALPRYRNRHGTFGEWKALDVRGKRDGQTCLS